MKRLGIRTQLAGAFALVLLILVGLFYFVLQSVASTLIGKNERYAADVFALELKNLDERYREIYYILINTGFDSDAQSLMRTDDALVSYQIGQKLGERFIYMKGQNGSILDVVLLGQHYNLSTKNGLPLVCRLFDRLPMGLAMQTSGIVNYKSSYFATEVPCVIFGARFLLGLGPAVTRENTGVVAVVYRAQDLLLGAGGAEGSTFFLVDRRGAICADSRADRANYGEVGQDIGRYRADPNYLVSEQYVPSLGMTLVSVTAREALLAGLAEVRTRFAAAFSLCAALAVALFALATHRLTHPFKRLIAFIQETGGHNPTDRGARIALGGSREMAAVSSALNDMLDQIGALTRELVDSNSRLYQTELEKERMRLNSLRSQINPHFLYNTLECIKGLAYGNQSAQIVEMAQAIARIFRYSIKGPDVVRLADELDIARTYLSIQALRFQHKFDVTFDFTNEALSAAMPKMILQPVVENAVCHGIEPKLGRSTLALRGRAEGGVLVVTVADDGDGMAPDTLAALRQRVSILGESPPDRDSIGIANISNRIKLAYGCDYGVTIDSAEGAGTTVTIALPMRGEENCV